MEPVTTTPGPKFVAGLRWKHNWQNIGHKAWSVRLMAGAAVLSGVESAFLTVEPYLPWAPAVIAGLTFLLVSGAFVARLVAQKNLKDDC